jgi:hypothetical protein
MLINIGVSSQWKVVTFKGTHLIERMSLLTLYIRKTTDLLNLSSLTNVLNSGRGCDRYP